MVSSAINENSRFAAYSDYFPSDKSPGIHGIEIWAAVAAFPRRGLESFASATNGKYGTSMSNDKVRALLVNRLSTLRTTHCSQCDGLLHAATQFHNVALRDGRWKYVKN